MERWIPNMFRFQTADLVSILALYESQLAEYRTHFYKNNHKITKRPCLVFIFFDKKDQFNMTKSKLFGTHKCLEFGVVWISDIHNLVIHCNVKSDPNISTFRSFLVYSRLHFIFSILISFCSYPLTSRAIPFLGLLTLVFITALFYIPYKGGLLLSDVISLLAVE